MTNHSKEIIRLGVSTRAKYPHKILIGPTGETLETDLRADVVAYD